MLQGGQRWASNRRRSAYGVTSVIDTLRKLQAEGLSAAQIALHLNQAFDISVTRIMLSSANCIEWD